MFEWFSAIFASMFGADEEVERLLEEEQSSRTLDFHYRATDIAFFLVLRIRFFRCPTTDTPQLPGPLFLTTLV